MIDIYGGSADPRAARLSNLTDRPFIFDGIACASIEGILQALKEQDQTKQIEICALAGKAAKRSGAERDSWKIRQILWWKGTPYIRTSTAYQILITCIYNAAYEQNASFKDDLQAVELHDIGHSIGNPDPRDTVLTEVEMIHQLNRLRIQALRHSQQEVNVIDTHTITKVPKYRGVPRDGNPVTFLKKHYATLLSTGRLNQLNLRRTDEKLLNAVKYEMRKNHGTLSDIIPSGINR